MQLGTALSAATAGIGPVIATGLIATALLGVIGAVSGAAAGGALETSTTEGVMSCACTRMRSGKVGRSSSLCCQKSVIRGKD